MKSTFCLDDFDYHLPAERIAQMPLVQRSSSLLLELVDGRLYDRQFVNLPELLNPGDLLVVNDTRVLHARLRGQKTTGGQVEVLIERLPTANHSNEAIAQIRASKSPKPGSLIRLEDAFVVEVVEREGEFYRLRFDGNALELIEQYGRLPLPPYMEREAQEVDELRYQTVYAREAGSVAAPTAGLHFDVDLLERMKQRGINSAAVTLHVGAGTFQPVRVQNLAEHQMHRERFEVPPETVQAIKQTRAHGGRVVAVGTTSLRALESSMDDTGLQVGAGDTALFITPGYKFRCVDLLITNFHLPKSTLLMLVSAFSGVDEIRSAYAHAIAGNYRFFSYGDAMLLHRKSDQ
ncbi:MAG: tRNA preQ1(34) S-adenosylmethionine ribosyltransferase-isomerase QueA [Rhodocyclaceae bacterium]|nr:tRNA preQ1(34) S-adenosylmethionine ribosyltransferase-isomerase QueA [Rhodocyclaceae bacterium]